MKQRLQSKQGITLVALVVTIIVLIILAGVSISLVLGDNGIVIKAKLGKQEMANAQELEDRTLQEFENEIDLHIASSSREYFTETELWSGNITEGDFVLSDDFTNYKSIVFMYLEGSDCAYSSEYLTSSIELIKENEFIIVLNGYNNRFIQFNKTKDDNRKFSIDAANGCSLYKVIGLK